MPLVTGNESGTKWGRLRRLSEVLRSQGMQASQQVTGYEESGTHWGRRLRLDATGSESDGSVRILGGRALS